VEKNGENLGGMGNSVSKASLTSSTSGAGRAAGGPLVPEKRLQDKNQPIVDYHVHSTLSVDGKSSIVDICRSALTMGLSEVGFAEHLDLAEPIFLNYEMYTTAINKAREEFRGRLTVRKGVEVDYQSRYLDAIAHWLDGKEFDFVIGSVHFVEGKPIDLGRVDSRTLSSLYPGYCREVILSVESGLFEVIGHFDLISSFTEISTEAKRKHVSRVLEALLDSDAHLEVNSRGFREGRKETVPGTDILRDFFKEGGRKISIGSDAHSAESVGSGIRESLALIRGLQPPGLELLFQA